MQHVFRASVLTVLLCSCISLHHSGAAQRQGSSTQPSLSQPCHVTAHLAGEKRAASVPCAHHLVMSGSTPGPARPMQSRARQCLVPAGGHWMIRHGLLGGVTKCFSLFSGVTPTADLCVSLLLAMSNHSPAVQFIWTASVIPVKCSA